MARYTFLKNLAKETEIRYWPVIFHVILIECGLFNREETRADLTCEGKHPSESNKLTIDAIGVTDISIQSFTKLVGIGSKSDDLHGADRTRWRTSSSVAWVGLCRTSLVLGGVNTLEHEPEEKEDWMMENLFKKKKLKVLANAAIEEWSGR